MRLPAMSKWFMLRVIDRPSAPASIDLAHQATHELELGVRRVSIRALLAHGVEPDGRVADERADVHAEPLPDRAHVLGEVSQFHGTPACRTSIGIASTYDSMPASFSRASALTGASASEQLPMMTVGRSVMAGVGAQRVPHDLRVVVAVVVDEARRDGPAVGLDGLARGAAETPHLDDLAAGHGDVAVIGGPTRAVDDASVLDEQVVEPCRCSSLRAAPRYC